MFSIPGLFGLIFFLFARPSDIFEEVAALPLPLTLILYVASALGILLDMRLGLLQIRWSPLTTQVAMMFGWCLLTAPIGVGGPAALMAALPNSFTVLMTFGLISSGVDTFVGFRKLVVAILVCSMVVMVVCAHQAVQPLTCCVIVDELHLIPDGRACELPRDCRENAPVAFVEYACERPGLLGTSSVAEGRVRYTGRLQDPNECALVIAAALPILVSIATRKKRFVRFLFAGIVAAFSLLAIVNTASRGGVLAVLAVLACLSMRDLRVQRLLYAGVMGLPMLFVGGREGESAESSTLERLEAWYRGVEIFYEHPILGTGIGQFTDHHERTAHNAYILSAAELGLVGCVLWLAVLYMSAKIAVVAFLRYRLVPGAAECASSGFMVGSMFGAYVMGIFFLSFSYHVVLWIHIGLAGALYNVIRRHDPTFTVRLSWKEYASMAVVLVLLLNAIAIYARSKI